MADGTFSTRLDTALLQQKAADQGLVQIVTIADTPPGTPPAVPQYSTVRVGPDGAVSDVDGGTPDLLVGADPNDPALDRTGPVAPTVLGSSSSAVCYTALTKWETTAAPDTAATIAQLQIGAGATGWAAAIEYTNTRTTALETGYAVSAGVPSLSFNASGTVTRSSSASSSASTNVPGNANVTTNRKVVITIGQSVDHYRCWQSPTTAPANPGYWPEYSVTVVPGVWKRDFYQKKLDNTALNRASLRTASTGRACSGESPTNPGPRPGRLA